MLTTNYKLVPSLLLPLCTKGDRENVAAAASWMMHHLSLSRSSVVPRFMDAGAIVVLVEFRQPVRRCLDVDGLLLPSDSHDASPRLAVLARSRRRRRRRPDLPAGGRVDLSRQAGLALSSSLLLLLSRHKNRSRRHDRCLLPVGCRAALGVQQPYGFNLHGRRRQKHEQEDGGGGQWQGSSSSPPHLHAARRGARR
jgi:hypothetical protein